LTSPKWEPIYCVDVGFDDLVQSKDSSGKTRVSPHCKARNMHRPFPHDPQHWRLRAEEARINAELFGDPASRRLMHEIADRYEQIAQRAEERMQDSEKRPAASSIPRSRPNRRKRWF
jgi:hypothetical protein